jgi:hypothetical protein
MIVHAAGSEVPRCPRVSSTANGAAIHVSISDIWHGNRLIAVPWNTRTIDHYCCTIAASSMVRHPACALTQR